MKLAHISLACALAILAGAAPLAAQKPETPPPSPRESAAKLTYRQRASAAPAAPQGFRQYVAGGKLRLSLDSAIRLALANNTDIRLDQTPIETARDQVQRAHGPFDPAVTTGFNATRASQPAYTQLQGAPTLSQLTQDAQLGYSQTFETGTNVQLSLSANKLSSNSTFSLFNPSVFSTFSFSFAQPLLRGGGLFPNRAPIVIAQRNLAQARDDFQTEVNDVVQTVVSRYWSVVRARENLAVQKKSLAQARKSYERDKRALQLGALPPLDIYRSESQVAQRRVSVIQAQYALMQTEDEFRRAIGADLDPNVRALELDLTEKPEPSGALMSIDIATALRKALANRPEIASVRERLASDETSIRLARNNLRPDLSLTGSYTSSGLGGNEINTTVNPPVIVSTGGFGDSLHQTFGFGFPTYQMGFSLRLPIRNRAAKAGMGDALANRRHDLYSQRRLHEAVTLDVTNAVHQLEQSKLSMEAAKVSYNLAEKNLQAEQHKYDLGAEQIFFVLEAQTELAQAEQTLVDAEVGYRLAVTAVNHATGALLDRYRVEIADLAR